MKGKLKRLLVVALSVIMLTSTISADVLAVNSNSIGPFTIQPAETEEDSGQELDGKSSDEKPDEEDLDKEDDVEKQDEEDPDGEGSDEQPETEPETEMCDLIVDLYVQDSENEEIVIFEESIMHEFKKGGQGTISIPGKTGYDAYLMDEKGNKTGDPITSVTRTMNQSSIVAEVLYVPREVKYTVIHNFDGREPVTETLLGKVGAMTKAEVKTDDDGAEGYKTAYVNQQVIQPEGTVVTVYYYYVKVLIVFDSQGGSFVDPIEVTVDDVVDLNKVAVPTRVGYTFDGWYRDGVEVTKISNVTDTVTLEAHWTAKQVNYTVNYWKQKVTDKVDAADADKKYDFGGSREDTALAGAEVSPSRADTSKPYTGFRYNAALSKSVTVNADGTTVLNVYYDRVKCTVNFYAPNERTLYKTISGLYGASFNPGEWDTSVYQWQDSGGKGAVLLTNYDFETAGYRFTREANGDHTARFYSRTASGRTVYYYNEKADGSYELVDTVTSNGGSNLTISSKYAGYTAAKYTTELKWGDDPTKASFWEDKAVVDPGTTKLDSRYKTVYIANTLQTNMLVYRNYDVVTRTVPGIKYTASLEAYGAYVPERPAELASYYTFAGWYADEGCIVKFDFSKETMPNADLQVYAKWEPETCKVVVHYNDNTASEKSYDNIPGGITLAKSGVLLDDPVRDGYVFAGWYLDAAYTQRCSQNKVIEEDLDIYAKWDPVSEVDFTIQYVDESGKQISDSQSYIARLDMNGHARITVAAKSIDGYVAEKKVQVVDLNRESKDVIVIFYYKELKEGFFVLQYVDEEGNEIYTEAGQSNNKRPYVRVSTTAPDGYTCDKYVVADEFGTEDDPAVCVVKCKRLKYKYTVKFLDKDKDSPLRPSETIEGKLEGDTISLENVKEDIKDIDIDNIKDGYVFDSKKPEILTIGSNESENVIILYYIKRNDLSYTVNYHYDDVVVPETKNNGIFGDPIPYTKDSPKEYNGENYILEKVVGDGKTIGMDSAKNVVDVYYTLDKIGTDPDKGDGIPDKYQATFTYVAEANAKGTVSGKTSEVVTVQEITVDLETGEITAGAKKSQSPTQPSTVEAEDGYHFSKWTDTEGTEYPNDEVLKNAAYDRDQTFTAHFEADEQTYYVKFMDEDKNEAIETSNPKDTTYGETISAIREKKEIAGYVFVRAGNDLTVTTDNEANYVELYYSRDEKRTDPENPDRGDGIPDKWQITITYEAASGGSVIGTRTERYTIATFTREEDGTFSNVEVTPVNPNAEVTAEPDRGYHFVHWADGSEIFDNTEDVRRAEVEADTTYTAYFEEDGAVLIQYLVNGKGKVSVDSENVRPSTGNAEGSEATAATGYHFVNWTNSKEEVVSEALKYVPGKDEGTGLYVAETYTANFEADAQKYHVKYRDVDTKETIAPDSEEKDTVFDAEILGSNEVIEISGYTFVSAINLKVGTDNSENVVIVYYSEDTKGIKPENPDKGDGIPDKYQITFEYRSEDTGKGSVTGTRKEVKTVQEISRDEETSEIISVGEKVPQRPTQPSTVSAHPGYHFSKWTDAEGTEYLNDEDLRSVAYDSDQTFTAHFEADEQTYYVRFMDEDKNEAIEISDPKATTYGETISAINEKKEIDGYVFVRAGNDLTVTTNNEANYVELYYSRDEKRTDPENPDRGDGIPDKWQITITYEAASGGSVRGTLTERHTIATYTLQEDGTFSNVEVTPVNPNAEVTAEPDRGYHFAHWTDGREIFDNTEDVRRAEVEADTTYKAYFEEDDAVLIQYLVNGEGKVSVDSENVMPSTGKAEGSEATAATGYHFVNWTNGKGVVVSEALKYVPGKDEGTGLYVAETYTANFEADAQKYHVEYRDVDTKETIAPDSEEKDTVFNAVIKLSEDEVDEVIGYSFVESDELTVGTNNEENIVTVYYRRNSYNLVIHYRSAATGETLANDFIATYLYKQVYGPIYSPVIAGYTVRQGWSFVRSEAAGMPASNVEITVWYDLISGEDPAPTPTPTPEDEDPVPPATPVPPVTPIPPVDPEPVPTVPVAPVDGVAVIVPVAGDGLVAVDDAQIPLGAAIVQDDDGNIVVVPVEEEEVPLADKEIDEHKCCVLSFLLMLAALIIYTWFTHSMKKRQKKLAELKDQLEEEKLKRKLGITDNQQAKM